MMYVLTEEQVREAFRLCESGRTVREVAKQFFVSRGTIERAFSRFGLRRRQRFRRVKNLTTGEQFPSISAAARAYEVNVGNIKKACEGHRNHCGGYQWAYVEEVTP